MKLGLFGNCQAEGLALSLGAWAPGHVFIVESAVRLPLNDPEALGEIKARLLDCDHVLVQSIETRHPRLEPFVADLIAAAGARAERWPIIIFNGFHPDCTYVLHEGAAVAGALGPYHSALAAAAWFEGLEVSRVSALFNAYTYACLGYFDVFRFSFTHLQAQAAPYYDLASLLGDGRIFMHTINHPTIDVSMEIARQALDRLGLSRGKTAIPPADPLARSEVWPIYPEIAERLELALASVHHVNIDQLVLANYRALDAAACGLSKDTLAGDISRDLSIGRARKFIRSEVI